MVKPESAVIDGIVRQRIKVGRLPIFVVNADLHIAKWRLNCRVSTYRLANGEELINRRLWLRAEEIGGERRVPNYQIRIEK